MIPVGTLCRTVAPHMPAAHGKLVTIVAGVCERDPTQQSIMPELPTPFGIVCWGSPPFLVPIAPPGDPDKVDEREPVEAFR